MKLKHFLLYCCYVLGMLTIQAQTKAPEGAAAKKALKVIATVTLPDLKKRSQNLKNYTPNTRIHCFLKRTSRMPKGLM